ncbi:MAG: hypothetical protein IPJ66_13500 [Bacteroidetes bacterium]|nr:hypothetical protein [Bacteroidota bacterium]
MRKSFTISTCLQSNASDHGDLLISQNQKSFATHMAGADLTYRYLGNNQYEINYTFIVIADFSL